MSVAEWHGAIWPSGHHVESQVSGAELTLGQGRNRANGEEIDVQVPKILSSYMRLKTK